METVGCRVSFHLFDNYKIIVYSLDILNFERKSQSDKIKVKMFQCIYPGLFESSISSY